MIFYNKQAACLKFIKKASIFKMIFIIRSWDLTENDGKKDKNFWRKKNVNYQALKSTRV